MAVLGCMGDTAGPKLGPRASLSLLPVFQSRTAFSVPFDRARVTLTRSGGIIGSIVSGQSGPAADVLGATALDTTVNFPPGVDSMAVRLLLPITGETETLTLDLWLINAAGDTVYRGGPVPVTATVATLGAGPAPVTLRYVGIGANAASVRIATRTAALFVRDSVVLTASAFDGNGQPIPGTPIAWRSLDSVVAHVPSDTVGKVVAGIARGVARIEAMLPTNLTDTARVSVQPLPAAVSFLSGDAQTGQAGTALPQPLVARVTAADILPVRNVFVHFAITAGGGKVSSDSVLTDSLGQAQVTWTLGPTAGVQAVAARVAGVPGNVSVAATATPGPPFAVAFTTQPPASTTAGTGFGAVVTARDSLGNTTPSFTGNVTVAITSGTGKTGATLHGTTTVAAVAGVATFAGLNIDSAATGYTLTATAAGLASATSSAFTIAAGPAASLVFTAQPPASVTAPTAFGFTVTARDAGGNTATSFTGAVTAAIAANPATGTLAGTVTQNAVAGVATFSGLSIDNIGTGYTLGVTATGLSGATSTALNVVAPAGVNAWINTSGGNWSLATNWSKSTVPVATDTVWIKQSGTYTVTLTANGTAARLDLGAPTGIQTLALGSHTLAITGNLSTAGSSAVQMTVATDSLNVGGNATFGGGASTLSAGSINVGGNFVQSGATNSFAPTGTFVVLNGGAVQTVTFASPATSFFRRLTVNKTGGGVVLGSNVRASFFRVLSNTAVTGPTARLFTDSVFSPLTSGPTITPLAVEITAVLFDSAGAGFSPDTTVFTGASQAISPNNTTFGAYAYKSIRVAQSSGTAAMAGPLTLPNDLVISSGGLSLSRFAVDVNGNFRTEGSGVLMMTSPTDSLGVLGNVTFAGGSTSGTLTTGSIGVGGNFTQSGSASAFASSGTRVIFARPSTGLQTVQFADSVNSFFFDLVLNRTTVDTVRLLSNVQVQDSALLAGTSVLASTNAEALKLPSTGVLVVHTQAVLRPFRVEAGNWELDSLPLGGTTVRISPDTAVVLNGSVFNSSPFVLGGAGISSPAFVAWKSLRLTGGTLTSNGTIYSGNLIIAGGTYTLSTVNSVTDSIGGFLRTDGSGVLWMQLITGTPTVVVGDSAVFAGGNEAGLLANGTLRLRGNFVQRNTGSPSSFQATTNHLTAFVGSHHTVSFASPGTGAAQSAFGNVFLGRPTQPTALALLSNVAVTGQVQDTSSGVADSIISVGDTLTTSGFTLANTVFSNTPVVVLNTAQPLTGSFVTFANMSPTVTQLTFTRGGAVTLTSVAFLVAPTGAGKYFSATSTALAGPAAFTFATPVQPTQASPPSATQYTRSGLMTLLWGTVTLP